MLNKVPIDISFAQGLDTKTDPKRLLMGRFSSLSNVVFQKQGRIEKRNGYKELASLPDNTSTYITTFKDNLTAVSPSSINAYSVGNESWVNKGIIQPISVDAHPLIRNTYNQTAMDSVTANNGLICVAYEETNGVTTSNKYSIIDGNTQQSIINPTLIPSGSGTVSGFMRCFYLGVNFIIVFTNNIAGVNHLQYMSISSVNPTNTPIIADISSNYAPYPTVSFDGIVVDGNLFIAYNTTSGGQSIKVVKITNTLTILAPLVFSGAQGVHFSITNDGNIIYIIWGVGTNIYGTVIDVNLGVIIAPALITIQGWNNITASAYNGSCNVFVEVGYNYAFDASVPSNYIIGFNVSVAGVFSNLHTVVRSVGIASKSFVVNGVVYLLTSFSSPYQPTYFLINGTTSTSSNPAVIARLSYSNGGGYLIRGLPSPSINGNVVNVPCLFKDLIQAVNKNTNVPSGNQVNGIYSQTGINQLTFTFSDGIVSSEIGNNLHISGGFMWMYDGIKPVEHNFFLWPDTSSLSAVWNTSGGSMKAQPDGSTNTNAYFYQFTYEWTDNQGNTHRSAPSIPVSLTTTGSGTVGSVTLSVPTLRLTYKIGIPVKICIYRWSVAQQAYYLVTPISSPLINDTTVDYVTFTDKNLDSTILGNALLYTSGGVVENISSPATNIMTLFDTRLWLVDAEDKNLLWYSKQVIENVPVEMSDLLTLYVSPTASAQGSTGPITALSVMDDKLIIFKKNAIYYINGTGPDNTGSNSQYSQPIFINSTVGCISQHSIVFMPMGLMFQSDKGIWLLDRSLNTSYIGAPVEDLTISYNILSSQNIPTTNQVRFIVDSGKTLMYDYYFGQWSVFTGVPAVSSCLFEDLHTFINKQGNVLQETPGKYLDGGVPVLISFTTGPIKLGDLQNYQRAYSFFLIGSYLSPHKLVIQIAYDYSGAPSQQIILTPPILNAPYGSFSYGATSYGGSSLEQYRVFLQQQRCQAFTISLQEVYDSSMGLPAGGGINISGINVLCALKGKHPTIAASQSFG